ncbi:MAG: hypothetical protein ACK5IM_02550 [Demequina sp.]|uniref:hypothetical protein n=1 Tax=Demequina sp. TaxID=2050685 RepID=UPI003A849224
MTFAAGARLVVLPVTAAAALGTARVTVDATGIELYGYVALIGQLFMLFTFSDLGIGAAITRAVARENESPQDAAVAEATVWRGWTVLAVAALAGVLLVSVVGMTVGWDTLLGIPEPHGAAANAATTGALCLFLAFLPVSSARRVLVGQGRSTLLALMGVIPPLVGLAVAAGLAVADAPAFAFALAPTVGMAAYDVACMAVASRRGAARDAWRRLGRRAARPALPNVRIGAVASSMLVLTVANAALIQGSRIVLAHRGDAAELTEYSLVLQLYLPLWSVIYMASTVLWARFAVREPGRAEAWRANAALAGLAAGAGIGLVVLGPWLTRFMSGGRVDVHAGVFLACAALLVVVGANATQAMWFTDAPGLRFQAVCGVAAVAVALPLAWALIGPLGASGAALASAAAALAAQTVPGWRRAWRRTPAETGGLSANAGGAA